MRFSLPIFGMASLAGSAIAVDINIYPNSESCDDNSGGLQCGGVGEGVCCNNGGGDFYSARFVAMDTSGVPDQGVIAQGPGPDAAWCNTACNAGGGDTTFCIDPAECPAATGAYWIAVVAANKRGRRSAAAKCEKAIKPDRAFFGNGQSFRINYDVPSNVTDLLVDLVKSDPHLAQGVPAEVLPWEIVA